VARFDPKQIDGRVQALVDFGHASGGEDFNASVTVAAPWVRADSIITCTVDTKATPDHSGEDALAEGLRAYPSNIVPGIGFDILVSAPDGTWGRYYVNASGV